MVGGFAIHGRNKLYLRREINGRVKQVASRRPGVSLESVRREEKVAGFVAPAPIADRLLQ
jgi:hypothetical protein